MSEQDRENKIAFILDLLDKNKQISDWLLWESVAKVFEIGEQEWMAILSMLH